MIITRISGGIGNQLFQYAIGRALSLKNSDELKLDTHFFDLGIEKDRSFKLSHFNIPLKIAESGDFKKIGIPNPRNTNLFSRLTRKIIEGGDSLKPQDKKRIVKEQSFTFNQKILEINKSCYLSGVWQSEKYFKNIEVDLKKEIVLKDTPSSFFTGWSERIESSESVSLHIRRGDYVNKLEKHGICDVSYYETATEIISKKIKNPTFFVFSDDIEWAKNNVKAEHPFFFVSTEKKDLDYEELILMSQCKHNILANSSFSWWGAWLNQNSNKIVIAPKKWFSTDQIDTKDLIPKDWLSI